jgi:signal transduction histidine kinase
MGLSITHGIVLAHDGTIKVDSVVGHGTTVAVTLPRAQGKSHQRTPS